MINKEKLDRLYELVEQLKSHKEKSVRNSADIMEILLTNIDGLQEEIEHLREENEALKFDLDDKKYEEGARRRTRSEFPPQFTGRW